MTLIEALNILQPQGNNEEDVKNAFRAYALKYHPDRNGGKTEFTEMMKLGNLACEMLMKNLGRWATEKKEPQTAKEMTIDQELLDMINKVKGFVGVEKELRGVYLWVWGNTKPYKDVLKENGFRWAPKKKEWFYAANGRRPMTRREYTADEIRSKYQSQRIEDTIDGLN